MIFDKKTMIECEKLNGRDYEKELDVLSQTTGVDRELIDWASKIDGEEVTGVHKNGKIYCGKFIIREEWCISNEGSTR